MYTDYKKRLLYRQKASSEEGHDVNVSVWATRWTYPGANHATTGRARISTVTNFNSASEIAVGTIETWREAGWVLVEEYMDTALPICSADEVEESCLKMLEAFLMGVNFEYSGDSDNTAPPFSMGPGKSSSSRRTTTTTIKANEGFEKSSDDKDVKSTITASPSDDDDEDWV